MLNRHVDIVERIASSENELYSYSLQSGFRDKIRKSTTEAIDELLRRDKNFSEAIDIQTRNWDKEIALSKNDPDENIKAYGRTLIESLTIRALGKEKLIEKVVALMIEREKEEQEKKKGTI